MKNQSAEVDEPRKAIGGDGPHVIRADLDPAACARNHGCAPPAGLTVAHAAGLRTLATTEQVLADLAPAFRHFSAAGFVGPRLAGAATARAGGDRRGVGLSHDYDSKNPAAPPIPGGTFSDAAGVLG